MSSEIVCAIISGMVTLMVSFGTWHVSMKKDRDELKDELRKALTEYYEKNRSEIQSIRENDLQEIRNDLTTMGSTPKISPHPNGNLYSTSHVPLE